jgi:hypothetical protein
MSKKEFLVGLSISEPDTNELVRLGLSEIHVRHAFIEIVRHILARGWAVAYGGDFRAAGYTEALIDLVRTYDRAGLPDPGRVLTYLAWPTWLNVTAAQRAQLANVATLREVDPPDGAPSTLPATVSRQPGDLLWNSLALSKMRTLMNSEIDARVVLGGRVHGQQGLYPGIVEEAVLAIDAGLPLYVVGGFGGCSRLIASALGGSRPEELSTDYHIQHTPRYRALLEAARAAGKRPSFHEVVDKFVTAGTGKLHNGLTSGENDRLLGTDDADEAISLILRGLRNVAGTT